MVVLPKVDPTIRPTRINTLRFFQYPLQATDYDRRPVDQSQTILQVSEAALVRHSKMLIFHHVNFYNIFEYINKLILFLLYYASNSAENHP